MMHTAELLKVFAAHRGDAIVVPGRGGRHWVKLTNRETLDVPLGDPAMGGHAGFALGLALAQPDRKVVLFDSEGDILMSLGMSPRSPNRRRRISITSCWTTNAMRPPAASLYQMRTTSPTRRWRAARVIRARFAFTELDGFERGLPEILGEPGPVFVALKVLARDREFADRPAVALADAHPRQGAGGFST